MIAGARAQAAVSRGSSAAVAEATGRWRRPATLQATAPPRRALAPIGSSRPAMRRAVTGRGPQEAPGGASRIRKLRSRASASAVAKGGEASRHWEKATELLVDAAAVPFTFLLVPQVIKNTRNLMAGNGAALGILSAEGYFVSFMGNAMLMSYFVSREERGAVLVQALGVASNFAMLTQIYMAGFLPAKLYNLVVLSTVSCFAINIAKMCGQLEGKSLRSVWSAWQALLGIAGLAVVPQVLWQTFTSSSSMLPGAIAGAVGVGLAIAAQLMQLPEPLVRFRAALGACTATLLFMLQPVAQLAVNFTNPASLQGISKLSCVLAMVGNAMMVPRALYTRDLIWFTGSTWGYTLMGWGQLLSLFLARDASGARFLSAVPFTIATIIAFGYLAFVLLRNTRSRGYGSVGASLSSLQWPKSAGTEAKLS